MFARENIIWYAYFLPVCLVFTPKNVVLSFVFMLRQTLHTTEGFLHLQISTLWGNRTEEMSDGYSWEHVRIFNSTEILGWNFLEGGNLNSVNLDLLESILSRSSIMPTDKIYLSFSFISW